MRDLSHELGIGAPSLYAAFGSKPALFKESVKSYEQKYGGFIDAAIVEESSAVATLSRILTEAPQRYTRKGLPRGCLVVSGDAGTDDDKIRGWLAQFRNGNTGELVAKIEADITAGTLSADVDPQGLAAYVTTVLSGLVQRARDGAPRKELEDIAHIAMTALPAPSPSAE